MQVISTNPYKYKNYYKILTENVIIRNPFNTSIMQSLLLELVLHDSVDALQLFSI